MAVAFVVVVIVVAAAVIVVIAADCRDWDCTRLALVGRPSCGSGIVVGVVVGVTAERL